MNTKEDKIKIVTEFLDWLEEYTYYEIAESEYSDYGDGELTFHGISNERLVAEFKNWIEETDG